MNLRKFLHRRLTGRLLHRLLVGTLLVCLFDTGQQSVLGIPVYAGPRLSLLLPQPMQHDSRAARDWRRGLTLPIADWDFGAAGRTWNRGFPYSPHLGGQVLTSTSKRSRQQFAQATSPVALASPSESACFEIEARAKSGKIQLVWTALPGALTYVVYRGADADSVEFNRIGEVAGTSLSFIDGSVANESTHLYFVRAVGPGLACDSGVVAAHPTALRRPVNHPPVIYSVPLTTAQGDSLVSYLIRAADPNPQDVVQYGLGIGPVGMEVDPVSGILTWTTQAGDYEILVTATDGLGGTDVQTFTLRIPVTDVVVPDVVGGFLADAEASITGAGLAVGSISTTTDPSAPEGTVLSQDPPGGAVVSPGSSVALLVSSGPPQILVPDVVGLQQADAENTLASASLGAGPITTAPHPSIPAGEVISQDPSAGSVAFFGTSVALVVSTGPAPVLVPNVVGQPQVDAGTTITNAQLVVGDVTLEQDALVPEGSVIRQDPLAGTSAAPGSAVHLVISLGPTPVTVPDVVGQSQAIAEGAITGLGLAVGTVTTANHPSVPAGSVIRQDPAGGTAVAPGSAVALVISLGPVQVLVPDVVGLLQATAEAAITGVGLAAGPITTTPHPTVPAGEVISQEPSAGSLVSIGTSVALSVSAGPAPVLVPNVVGQPQVDAGTTITNAELVVGDVTLEHDALVPEGSVISQNPVAGTFVAPGSSVDLVLSLGPAPVTVPDVVGQSPANAEGAITSAGLTVGTISMAHHPSVPAGSVISQDPAGGTSVLPGSAVALVISLGPVQVLVPDVVGLLQSAAEAAIRGVGLTLGPITTATHPSVPAGEVISQDPAADVSVAPGTTVALLVSLGAGVAPDITLPRVTIVAEPAIVNPGESVSIQVQAADDVGVTALRLLVNQIAVPLDAAGLATYLSTQPGIFEALAEADDAAGHTGQATTTFRARTPADDGAPTVSLLAPASDTIISNLVEVMGTATDTDLAFFELQAAPADTSSFATFAQGNSSVDAAVLGQLDPRGFAPGAYDVRVCAEDTWGHRACSPARRYELAGIAASPGITRFGFFDGFVELAGLPITVRRMYDSRDKATGDFGVGWRLDTDEIKLQATREMGRDWQIQRIGSAFPTFRLVPTADHRVTAFLPDGSAHRFQMRPDPQQQIFVPIDFLNGAIFDPLPGTTSTLTPDIQPDILQPVLDSSGPTELFTIELELYNPASYRLRLQDGKELLFVQNGVSRTYRLSELREPNGNTIRFTPAGITHSSGASVSFVRDGSGRITSLIDPDGRTRTYAYDAAGDLVSSTDYNGETTGYRYDALHNLIQVLDPRGTIPGTLIYDSQNRVVGAIDAKGNRIDVAHDDAANQEVITDRLGNTTVHSYDDHGNLLSTLDALGQTTSYTYDAQGHLLTRTNPLGNVQTFTYDSDGHVLSYTDPLGHQSTQTYNAAGNVVTQTDPLGRTYQFEYSLQGNLAAVVTPRGGRIEETYNGAGQLVSYRSPTGESASFARNSEGRLTGYTFPGGRTGSIDTRSDGRLSAEQFSVDGNVVRYEYDYDANGNITHVQLPNNATASIRYDAAGLPTETTDSLNRTARVAFDANGNVTSHVDYDGRVLTFERDAENGVTAISAAGQRVERVLDPLGRPTLVRLPGNREIATMRDAAGRITGQQQTGEGATSHEYDAAGRVTRTTAPDGAVTRYTYDAASQLVSVTDPLNQPTQFEYDLDGNLVRTTFADGAQIRMEYDLSQRLTAAEDELGARLSYGYDAAGDLVTATDAAGGVTSYTYDAMGNLARTVGPAGRTWTFEYDLLGNSVAHTFPWGGTERHQLDAGGGITGIVDGAGLATQFQYDSGNRLTRRELAGGRVETLSYTPSGQLSSGITPGETATYSYTPADKVERIDYGAAGSVQYTYDTAGRLASLQTPSGTTTFTYDTSGRLTEASDSLVGDATYAYDAAGRLIQVHLPDGSITTYTRDVRGQVSHVSTVATGGAFVRDEVIVRDAAGNPVSIDEGARQVSYTFDSAGRVASETRVGADAASLDYQYDADWNLTGNGSRTQAYDAGGRLTSDGRFTNYTYDGAGRPLSRSDGTTTEQFSYDSLGRLIQVARTGSLPAQVRLDYNHKGLLSRVESDGVGRNLLWDVTATVPVLLEERNDTGALLRRYAYGLGPFGVAGSGIRVLHQDLLGSIRVHTALDGSVLERCAYSAYGERTLGAASDIALQFTGEYLVPELGLYFLRSRFYDPSAGRFLTPDLLEPNPSQPQTFNPYLYVGANPVRFRDPMGTFGIASISIGLSIASVLVSIALPHFPQPVLLIAKALGLTQADAQVGISLALSIGQGRFAGGLQVDLLYGPTAKMAILWIFAGAEIGSVRSDPRFGGVTVIFWAGPIYGESGSDPSDPRPGVYIMFSGTIAHVLGDFAFKGRDANSTKVQPQWSRGSGALQFEIFGVNKDATFGSSFRQAFTFYGAGWNALTGELDKIKFAAAGRFKFPGSGTRLSGRSVWNAGIALSVYLPILWVVWDGNGLHLKSYFDDLF